MSDAEVIASWVDQLSNAEAHEEATQFRRVLVAALKLEKLGFDGITPVRVSAVLQQWHGETRGNWPGLPELSPDLADQATALVIEWLMLFNDGKTTPALLVADDYVGVLHALRCALRGQPLNLPQQGAVAPVMRGNFTLKPKV